MNKLYILIAILFLQSISSFCQVTLPRLISDGVVLQRNEEVKIWGWASPSEDVGLSFKGHKYRTTADRNGEWEIQIPAQEAGGPYEMGFEASNKITVRNILFGDVWICSGQSNMVLPMERVKEKYEKVIKDAENPDIRQFFVPNKYDFKKAHEDIDSGKWQSASPQSVLGFSAVAYFFTKELNEKYQVPIGLINASLGGSPVEAWMSEDALENSLTPIRNSKDSKTTIL